MTLAEIVLKLGPKLEELPYAHAMWIEGSYATGLFEQDSDIDVWVDVDREKFEDVRKDFSHMLKNMNILRSEEGLDYYSQEPYLAKAKFYVVGKSNDQRIELDIQVHGRDFLFSRGENKIIVIFDKDNVINWKA